MKTDLPQSLTQRSSLMVQYEVIHMTDPIDKYTIQQLRESGEWKRLSAIKEGFILDNNNGNAEEDRYDAGDRSPSYTSSVYSSPRLTIMIDVS